MPSLHLLSIGILAHREIKREDDAVSLSSGTSEEDAVRSYLLQQQRLTPDAAFPPSSSSLAAGSHHYHALPPPPPIMQLAQAQQQPPPIAFPVPSPPYLRPQVSVTTIKSIIVRSIDCIELSFQNKLNQASITDVSSPCGPLSIFTSTIYQWILLHNGSFSWVGNVGIPQSIKSNRMDVKIE